MVVDFETITHNLKNYEKYGIIIEMLAGGPETCFQSLLPFSTLFAAPAC